MLHISHLGCYGHFMNRLGSSICAILLALVLWTGTAANAAERLCTEDVSAAAIGHLTGNDEGSPTDPADEATHQHSPCHGHCNWISVEAEPLEFHGTADAAVLTGISYLEPGPDPGILIRPPIA